MPETRWPVDPPTVDPTAPAWERRYRAVRVGLPDHAQDRPERCVLTTDVTGTAEAWVWDRSTGELRQATARPEGTLGAAIGVDGETLWWFDDTDGDEHGVWRTQPFSGGPDAAGVPDLDPSYPAGLALGPGGLAVVGRSGDDGTSVHLVRGQGPSAVGYASPRNAGVGGLSRDGSLLVVVHTERGDALHPALRCYRVGDGSPPELEPAAELDDGPGRGLSPSGWSPVAGDPRVLVTHERAGPRRLLLWDPLADAQAELDLDLPGDLDAAWAADGRSLLVVASARGRATLHRVPLADGLGGAAGPAEPLGPADGSVLGVVERPDGTVELRWSSSATPSVLRDADGAEVLPAPGEGAPPSVPVRDVDADGPGGPVHALLALPIDTTGGPLPSVFLLHGGPMSHDADVFDPERAAWVDAGYAVVQVNYRGSTGYGAPWQDAIVGRPGLTELEDVAAVRDALVAEGVVDPARCVVAGGSWGGYLTLLALGTQPDAWACGVAAVPVAHYASAYADEMEALRELDRTLFGGSPSEVPDVWRASDPYTHVDQVRAPVLVLAGANDPRCPLRQVEEYLSALQERGAVHEVYRFDAGHGSLRVDERVAQVRASLDFVARHVPAGVAEGVAPPAL